MEKGRDPEPIDEAQKWSSAPRVSKKKFSLTPEDLSCTVSNACFVPVSCVCVCVAICCVYVIVCTLLVFRKTDFGLGEIAFNKNKKKLISYKKNWKGTPVNRDRTLMTIPSFLYV